MKQVVRLDELPIAKHDALGHALPEAANAPVVTQTSAPLGWLARIDWTLGWLVEVPAALLVVADIGVLLAGVVARFALHSPLVWSDELASILFLWLAMFGSVIALRRGEHMRMTAVVARLSPGSRALMEAVATCACLAFLALVLRPAWQHASDEGDITTSALEISNLWREIAMPIGVGLMGVFAILRLLREASARHIAAALVLVGGLCAAFWFGRPAFEDLGRLNLLVFFVGVAAGSVLAGIPIAFAFGLGTFGYLALATGTPMPVIVGRMDEGMSHLILLAVPLFVFLGQLLEATGMARAMVAFLAGLLGHVRGGLSYVLVGAMYLVSGISGA